MSTATQEAPAAVETWRGVDLIVAARALIVLAEKKKLDGNSEGYATVQTLKDEISIFEIARDDDSDCPF
jgi:hypothetical protein